MLLVASAAQDFLAAVLHIDLIVTALLTTGIHSLSYGSISPFIHWITLGSLAP